MIDRVEEAFHIGIQYPIHLLARDRNAQCIKGLMLTASRAQGQRTLSPLCGKDLHQEVVAPAGDLTFAFDAVF